MSIFEEYGAFKIVYATFVKNKILIIDFRAYANEIICILSKKISVLLFGTTYLIYIESRLTAYCKKSRRVYGRYWQKVACANTVILYGARRTFERITSLDWVRMSKLKIRCVSSQPCYALYVTYLALHLCSYYCK